MKVAVIGTGFGQYAMAPVYRKLGFDVEVATPRDAAAVERIIASSAELISIHSPPFMHFDHVMRALDQGRAVLCDKPFGLDTRHARVMRDRARERGVLHFLNYEVRSKPSRAKIKELVKSGAIGEPRHLSWTFFSNGLRASNFGWVNKAALGGGWISAYASHCIDFIRWVFESEVAQCGGMARIEISRLPDKQGREHAVTAEDGYSAWFVMENGCTATQDTAYGAAVPLPMSITVLGSDGAIELVGEKVTLRRSPMTASGEILSAAERIRRGLLPDEGGEVFEFPPPAGEAHEPALLPWLESVTQAIRSGTQISPSFDDGVAVAQTMDQLKMNLVWARTSGAG